MSYNQTQGYGFLGNIFDSLSCVCWQVEQIGQLLQCAPFTIHPKLDSLTLSMIVQAPKIP
jgi:hypothetical protein